MMRKPNWYKKFKEGKELGFTWAKQTSKPTGSIINAPGPSK